MSRESFVSEVTALVAADDTANHVAGQFYSWSDGDRSALGLVIDNGERHAVVVFRWGAWPRHMLPEQTEDSVRELTKKETEVMWYVVDGKSNAEIGEELGLSHHTIKFHISNAINKLRCESREAAAVRFVLARDRIDEARKRVRASLPAMMRSGW
jgi:DNA-binding CsgD family transcriptional regulator